MGLLDFCLGIIGVVAGANIVQKPNTTESFVESSVVGLVIGVGGYLAGGAMQQPVVGEMFGSFGGGMILGGAGKAVITSMNS